MPAVAGSILTGAANPAPIRHLIVSTWGMFVFVFLSLRKYRRTTIFYRFNPFQ